MENVHSPPPSSDSNRPGRTSGRMAAEWADKLPENVIVGASTRWYQRPWVRGVALALFAAAGIAGAVLLGLFNSWRSQQHVDLARQRNCLIAFCRSEEFGRFTREMDRQFVALHNFITIHPQEVRALYPEVTAVETSRHQMPWVLQMMPLPIAAAGRPDAIAAAHREVAALLVQRGVAFDEERRKSGRQVFLRVLLPYVNAFVQRVPGNEFNAIVLDRTLQDIALAEFGRHFGSNVGTLAAERMFSLYAQVGPSMWRAIERETAARNQPPIGASATRASPTQEAPRPGDALQTTIR